MARTDASQDSAQGPDPASPDSGSAGDPLLSTRRDPDPGAPDADRHSRSGSAGAAASETSALGAGPLNSAPDTEPTESSRSAMFSLLVIVMASAPTYVALRAIRASRSADFPLGESLGNAAIVLFAVLAIALLSVCFWPSMSTATWGARTTGTMLGASGVVMACIGCTHAMAGIIGTGFLSEPAWLGWIVLIGVYPLAGQVASRLARDYVGEGADAGSQRKSALKSQPGKDAADGSTESLIDDLDAETGPDDDALDNDDDDDADYVRERSFGSTRRRSSRASDTRDGLDEPVNRSIDEPTAPARNRRASRPTYASDDWDEYSNGPEINSPEINSPEANSPEINGPDAYANDPFADPSEHEGVHEGVHDGDEYDDHGDWDDDEEWDDDPFADYDD